MDTGYLHRASGTSHRALAQGIGSGHWQRTYWDRAWGQGMMGTWYGDRVFAQGIKYMTQGIGTGHGYMAWAQGMDTGYLHRASTPIIFALSHWAEKGTVFHGG